MSALKWCARVATKPIIADGGIRNHGDIAKSIRFGASMVMIGSLFAGHEESPGKTVEVNGELFKEYYGSASDFNKGEYKHVEGKRILEPVKGQLANTLIEMEPLSIRAVLRRHRHLCRAINHGVRIYPSRGRLKPALVIMPQWHLSAAWFVCRLLCRHYLILPRSRYQRYLD